MSKPPNDAPNPFAGAQFLLSCAQIHQLPADDLPEIAFAGRSNAGKSSALNTLCGQNQLARVSKTPGRTQLINMFSIKAGRFADLPGYGYAKVARELRAEWGRLIGAYMDGRQNLRAAVLIMDIRHTLTDFDWQMLEWAQHRGLPCHALLTKADKLGYGAAKNTLLAVRKAIGDAGMQTATAQLFSSSNGLGLQEARETLHQLMTAPRD
jgi:GTP-binding protein